MDIPVNSKEEAPLLISRATSYQSLDTNSVKDPDSMSIVSGLTLQDFQPTAEEILFRMKYAHLNKGVDWIDFIENTTGPEEKKWSLQLQIRNTLKDYPLTIADKFKIYKYLQKQEVLRNILAKKDPSKKNKKGKLLNLLVIDFTLWENEIGHIAAYFGSNVASYFTFLRFLLYLNVFVGIVMFAFVSSPQIIKDDPAIPSAVSGYFGSLSTSVVFYGAYNENKFGIYDRALAYFFTWIAVNAVSFIVIVSSMYHSYKKNKLDNQDEVFQFSFRLFDSWDYGISNRSGVLDRQSAIKTDIKEMVREDKYQEKKTSLEFMIWIYVVRVLVNITVLMILTGSGYIIYLVANGTVMLKEEIPTFLQDLVSKYELPLTVSGLKVVVPPILVFLGKLERWHPRTAVKMNIIRTALFYLASLIVFVISLYEVSGYCVTASQFTNLTQNVTEFCCWENEVGEEIFKVVLFDLGIFILLILLLDGIRALLVKCHSWNQLNYSDFDVSSSVLEQIYGQALIWLGLYFSPFLALIGTIKIVITFYFRYFTARAFNTPPVKLFRASKSGVFYMVVLIVNLFVSLFPMIYGVIVLVPSYDCGPFRSQKHVYNVITSRIGELPDWLSNVLVIVSESTVIVPLLIFLLLLVIFYRAKSSLYNNLIKELRNQLKFERRVEKRQVYRKAKLSQGISSASGLDRIGRI